MFVICFKATLVKYFYTLEIDAFHFFRDIQKATKNFTTILGQGSFGPVYKATMPAGEVVAVKALASDSKQGEKEFQTEVISVSLEF